MKTIRMIRDFYYRPNERITIYFCHELTYHRVPELAARAIMVAHAGELVEDDPCRLRIYEQE